MDKVFTERLDKIEAELNCWLPDGSEFSKIKEIFPGLEKINTASIEALFAPGKEIISRGGKRWRPLLMTLICETLGGGCSALPLAPLVEFCHNASLIHDDIEDNSDLRRGKPAVHNIYGIDTAINSGSFFYFLSLCCVESYTGKNKEQIYSLWAKYMRKLHLGQAMDIKWHREISYIPDSNEYYAMCGLKTGSLAGLAAELGVFAAGVSGEASNKIALMFGEAAEKLGIGFQILDDVRNLTTGIYGKQRGDDIAEGKKSLPVLLYLQKFPEKREKIFYYFHEAKTIGVHVPEVEEMIITLTDAGVITEAQDKAQSLICEARGIFNSLYLQNLGLSVNEESCALLDSLISLIS